MKYEEVRCCCDPGKLLGYLPAPIDGSDGRTFYIARPVETQITVKAFGAEIAPVTHDMIRLRLREWWGPHGEEGIAYKSDNHEDKIKNLPEFVPARPWGVVR